MKALTMTIALLGYYILNEVSQLVPIELFGLVKDWGTPGVLLIISWTLKQKLEEISAKFLQLNEKFSETIISMTQKRAEYEAILRKEFAEERRSTLAQFTNELKDLTEEIHGFKSEIRFFIENIHEKGARK